MVGCVKINKMIKKTEVKITRELRIRIMKIEFNGGFFRMEDINLRSRGEPRPIVCKQHPAYNGLCDGPDDIMTEELYCSSTKNNHECERYKLLKLEGSK